MYIWELIKKLKESKKQILNSQDTVESIQQDELEDVLTCKHVFMPIDSTKTVLACVKCGYVIKNEKLKFSEIDKNPFKQV